MPSAQKRLKKATGTQTRPRRSRRQRRDQESPDHSTDREDEDTSEDSNEGDDTDEDDQQDKEDLTVANVVLPTLANYATLGVDCTDAYLEKVLASRKIGSNNRPSAEILLEAQALQDNFQRSLKMLSLAGQISYPTLKAALFLGPSQRATTSYDTYRAYSKKNTQETAMPARNTRPGFAPRNKVIGNTWTNLNIRQKAIFNPPFFKRLAEAVLEPDSVPRSTEEKLVNMNKVKRHFERQSLGMPQSAQSEKKGRLEVSGVVKQLSGWTNTRHVIDGHRGHSMPTGCFHKKKETKIRPPAAKEQTRLRTELTSRLNQLVETQLPYPPRPGVDIHPKGPRCDLLLAAKKFLQGVRLQVHCTQDCQITDAMLEKGAAPGNMSVQQVRLWLKEIADLRYTVILASPPQASASV
ncbi:uncharacterized protein MELLADRAFT_84134 [Melampsora larici-populina 98AG31]|uniref:Uncharacterized protein n=1 Tax=Melampsora larici-populina (strain 98AG31 / pathotype 3-4-7) TaxID=747676 RepID=F4SBL5_MELLP|nr:uncharacterized protein MELLADRAFT_84134 [Melampsora larici-populina 98AG31]EGF97948.1 hypothetical protein MELLADRAFT_84134 [Melampsora larici-populina 98AG31]